MFRDRDTLDTEEKLRLRMQRDVPWQRHAGYKGKGETGCSVMFCGRETLDTKEKVRQDAA